MLRWLFAPLDRTARWILAAAALVRAVLLLAGAAALDRAFVVDDAYYTLSIARTLGEKGLPSVDGTELTSGFQPLLAMLEAPAFLVRVSADQGLLWGLGILLAADWLIAVLLARLAARAAGSTACITTLALWAFSPVALTEALVGLEGSISVAVTLLAATLLAELDNATRRTALLVGFSLGLCLLARIDTAPFVVMAGLWLIWKHKPMLPMVVAPATAVAFPWLLFCTWISGKPWPESGDAVRSMIDEGTTAVSMARCAGWAAGYVIPGGLADVPELRDLLVEHPMLGAGACVALLLVAGAFAWRLPITTRLWVFGALALVPFYAIAFPAIWGFHRYLLPARVATTLLYGLLIAIALERIPVRAGRWVRAAALPILAGNLILMLIAAYRAPARGGMDRSTGYRAAALSIHARLPSETVLGAFQSGALGFYRPANVTVVNLDGVVSRSAHQAFVGKSIGQFLKTRSISYVADWKSGLLVLLERSGDSVPTLLHVYTAPPQGKRQFLLVKITWVQR